MSEKPLDYFDLGISLGFSSNIDEHLDVVFVDIPDNNYVVKLGKQDSSEYVKNNCVTIVPGTHGYKLNYSYSQCLSALSDLKNKDNGTISRFVIGFVSSNAQVLSDSKENTIVLTSTFPEVIEIINDHVVKPSYLFLDNSGVSKVYYYDNEAALDLLNCHMIHYRNSGLLDYSIDNIRRRLTNGYEGEYLSYKTIRYVRLHEDAAHPSKSRASDTGYDLTLIREVKTVGDVTFYGTGIAVSPPTGYYFDLVPRSSLSKQGYMLANSVGIIDSTYRGEIIVALRKFGGFPDLALPARAVQIVPRKLHHFDTAEEESLDDTIRNFGGFGSTGS